MYELPTQTVVLKVREAEYPLPARKALNKCLSFAYVKEYYTPYTSMKASFLLDQSLVLGTPIELELAVNGAIIHIGPVDTFKISEVSGKRLLNVTSRGYTAMMGQNELVPGLMTNPRPSLNVLMENFIKLPSVYHENLATTSNFVYVKEHASMWEAVCNLCLSQNNTYPYIKNPNTVRYTKHSSPKQIVLSRANGNIVAAETTADYTKLISDIHMKDTNGTYNTYNISDAPVKALQIVRHKHVALDRQWLDNVVRGLGFRVNFAMRGYKSSSVTYIGYQGEDINDRVSFEGIQNKYISKLNIAGSSKGITTKLTCYFDRYCNV